jgi:hypothetical protein
MSDLGAINNPGAGSGSGTVNNGNQNQLAYYAGNGTAVSGTNAIPAGTTATTASIDDNSTNVATTAYADKLIATGGFHVSFSGNTTVGAAAQNTTKCWAYISPISFTTTKVTYDLGVADNTGNNYDIGFYNSAGTLIGHIGATAGTTYSPSTGVKTLNWLSSFNIFSGERYYFAMTTNAAATPAQFAGQGNVMHPHANLNPSAGNATTGGVLNNSITPAADVAPGAFATIPGTVVW